MSETMTPMRLGVAELAAAFDPTPGYLAACGNGVLPRAAITAMSADLARCGRGEATAADYDVVVTESRDLYAAIVGVPTEWVAIGSAVSPMVAVVAAGLPDGAEVLVATDEFSSMVLPFRATGRLVVRTVPLADVASAITDATAVVAFSLVQSATGEVADAAAITTQARAHQALTVVDLTQAAGVMPVDATAFDVSIAHVYKWLCSPRGVAFLTVRPEVLTQLRPVLAGWYSDENPWGNCYWPQVAEPRSARQFDTSPAWQAFVGARESLRLFAEADLEAVWAHACELGDQLCRGLGIPEQHRAIVSWPDPDHAQLARLTAAGLRASGPLGLIRVAFHIWNTPEDVAAVVQALGR